MNIEIETHNGEPVLLQLDQGPDHPEMPLTAFVLSQPLDAEQVGDFSKKIEALATLMGSEVEIPDEVQEILSAAEAGDAAVGVPIGGPYIVCWN